MPDDGETFEFTVPPECASLRIDVCAARLAPEISRARIQKAVEGGFVFLNGVCVTEKRTPVNAGDRLRFSVPENLVPVTAEGENIPLDILYEDDEILVIHKPAGMVVHPAAGNWTGTVVNAVLGHTSAKAEDFDADPLRPGIVHRLDRDTSGCLVIAKTGRAMHRLCEAFQERRVSKTYLAIVSPAPKVKAGTILSFIGRNPGNRKKMAVVRNETQGKKAETHFRCLRTGKVGFVTAALLEVRIMTGRTHQIRVHLSHYGSPVAGDPLYGGNSRLPEKRQMLHAWKLAFPHPLTGEMLSFEAPVPADFQACLNRFTEEKCP